MEKRYFQKFSKKGSNNLMPNIKKMKKKKDIEGLTQIVSKNDDPKARILAAQALKEIGDEKGIEALSNILINTIKFGEDKDTIEAMIIIQGRKPESLLKFTFSSDERIEALKNITGPIKLHYVQDALDEVIKEKKQNRSTIWFALLTLIELGDRREETLKTLIQNSKVTTKSVDFFLNSDSDTVYRYVIANQINCLIEQTIRALSYFKDNPLSIELLIKALDSEFLHGSYVHPNYSHPYLHVKEEDSICALGAIGNPIQRERLEYMENRGSESIRKVAKVALELYGRATYDEIKLKIKK